MIYQLPLPPGLTVFLVLNECIALTVSKDQIFAKVEEYVLPEQTLHLLLEHSQQE